MTDIVACSEVGFILDIYVYTPDICCTVKLQRTNEQF